MRRTGRLALLILALTSPAVAGQGFYLKDGDRVVFYGDSITDQRLYTTFVETYAVTRFPDRDLSFIHSGWGGDTVGGGAGGRIDERLRRDVFAYKPTVVTFMLGMNDARYARFRPETFERYSQGYEHIVEAVRSRLPEARLTLIVPSPYDDVTQKPKFEGGYNAVLLRYGEFVKELAKKNGLDTADLNTSVVEATRKAFEANPDLARKLNPDRIHPGPGGQLLMAAALLKAWNAPALVSGVSVRVEDDEATADTEATEVEDLQVSDGHLSWVQHDEALPFPFDLNDTVVRLAVRSGDLFESLNRQPLKVEGLPAGEYTLSVDGRGVGTFASDCLADGVNLATLDTPMTRQAAAVHRLTLKHNDVHFTRWRLVQVPLALEDTGKVARAIDALDAVEADMVKRQRAEARPKPRKFELTRKP